MLQGFRGCINQNSQNAILYILRNSLVVEQSPLREHFMNKQKILQLASKTRYENKFVDFKREIDINSALSWCEVVKDIIALANSGGGIILFGVEDNGNHYNFDKNIVLNLDPAVITEKVSKYINEDFTEFEIIEIKRGKKDIAAIYICGNSTPIVFSKNGVQTSDGKKYKSVFAEGTVYFRRGAKSSPGTTQNIRNSIERTLELVRKEWFKGMRQVSEVGMNEVVKVEVKNQSNIPANLTGLIKLSEKGRSVKFTNEHVEEIKKIFPLSYKETLDGCKKKRKVSQIKINQYMDKCKKDNNLSINWKLIAKNLQIPSSFSDKFTYSPKVIENF